MEIVLCGIYYEMKCNNEGMNEWKDVPEKTGLGKLESAWKFQITIIIFPQQKLVLIAWKICEEISNV